MINTRFKFFALTLICIFILNLNVSNADNLDKIEDDEDEDISVKFVNAWYTDLEGDGFEDDIVLKIKIRYEDIKFDDDDKTNVKSSSMKVKLKVELVLPSGFGFVHFIEKSINSDEVVLDLLLYNHAIETGWYWGHITIVDDDHNPLSKRDSIYFDPPGGRSGGTVSIL